MYWGMFQLFQHSAVDYQVLYPTVPITYASSTPIFWQVHHTFYHRNYSNCFKELPRSKVSSVPNTKGLRTDYRTRNMYWSDIQTHPQDALSSLFSFSTIAIRSIENHEFRYVLVFSKLLMCCHGDVAASTPLQMLRPLPRGWSINLPNQITICYRI